MKARNYHIHKIIVDDIEYEIGEFMSIESNETVTRNYEIILTETDEKNRDSITWKKDASLPAGNYFVVLKAGNNQLTSHKFTIQ